MVELTKIHANAAFNMMLTLRRLNLAKQPNGSYSNTDRVFNVWNFAKLYGVIPDVKNKS